jgi:3-oxoacyl-[acyl-carrier-protein] synthase II
MLACHVTILHDTQGPSNTITCAEASSGLSVGESLRVIQRQAADLCFCGGTESKLNPMAFLRQQMTGRLNTTDNDRPAQAVRPFCQTAAGTVLGEGGAIVVLESLDTYQARAARDGARAYAELLGFGASQSVHPEARNLEPDPKGHGLSVAIRAALREAGIDAGQIDLVVAFGLGVPRWDAAEAAALRQVFGSRLPQVPVVSMKPMVGNMGAGAGGLDLCIAALAVREQKVPATLNTQQPLDGLQAMAAPARDAGIRYALTYSSSLGGQNAALVLGRLN